LELGSSVYVSFRYRSELAGIAFQRTASCFFEHGVGRLLTP
jgi:hypothetical protein